MADWTQEQFAAYLREAHTAYADAMHYTDVSDALLDDMGGFFALAANDRRRLYHWYSLQSTMEQEAANAWRAHRAAIERLHADGLSRMMAVQRYLSRTAGTWPQSLNQLRQANVHPKTMPASLNAPQWYNDLARYRGFLNRNLARQPTALAAAVAIVHYLVSSQRDWQDSLDFGMDVSDVVAPVVGWYAAKAGAAPPPAPGPTQPTKPLAAEVRPDTRGVNGKRGIEGANRQTREAPRSTGARTTGPGGAGPGATGSRDYRSTAPAAPTSGHQSTGMRPGAPAAKVKSPPGPSKPAPATVTPTAPAAGSTAGKPSTAAPSAKPGASAAAGPAKSPPPALRAVIAEKVRNDPGAIDAVWRFIAKQPKLSRDLATVGRIAELYRTTRQLPTLKGLLRTFVSNRADAGELRVIYRLLKHERVQTIRLLQPVRQPGARTPDLEVTLVGGTKIQGPLRVEITTVTGAAAGARTRAHTPAGAQEKTGGKPVEADRPATPEDVVEAVRRKLDRGQAAGGVIAVNVPFGTNPPLTRAHVDRIKQLWRTHRAAGGTVLEIWIVRPQTAQNPAPVSYVAGVGLGLTAPYRP